ncbi:LuxR family transcriptional regulator [Streptomyces sp. P9(2023)]|uniref:LuxR family transcriptional regulator n=1 Tax=Streptomyces sp. P9(2023) TaxID=3064394 RepID=UPI0028F3F92B|nr:LuxR family transcriptional regulator [Streptomyces sp. P9(2023)]MDT9687058.1 LuxR family transcriptional regulator [Streptomyces sp. P9(2023)]
MEADSYFRRNAVDGELLRRVYACVLGQPLGDVIDVSGIAAELDLPVMDTHTALAELTEIGLLRTQSGRGIVAVSPDEAVSRVVGPLELELQARRVHIEETRRRLTSFAPVFDASLTRQGDRRQVDLIESLTDVRMIIAELAAKCREEILTAQPGGGRREEVLVEAAPRDYEALRRGVTMRILYQHTARSSRGTHAYVEQVTGLGAHVRTTNDEFTRLLIFDRECAVFATSADPNVAAIVRDPNVVAFMVDAYQRLWLAAEPFVADSEAQPEITDDLKEAIVRLLTAGMTDVAVARRLGMSVRTCRRHVAEIMATIDAESRFQAGYLLAQREHSA